MSENVMAIQSSEEFEKAAASGVVLADFWAEWCGPCRAQGPILDRLAEEFLGKAKIIKVNVDENGALAGQFNIASIPTLYLFKNGQMIREFIGVQSEKVLADAIKKVLPEEAFV